MGSWSVAAKPSTEPATLVLQFDGPENVGFYSRFSFEVTTEVIVLVCSERSHVAERNP
jgi:hypothetical protein